MKKILNEESKIMKKIFKDSNLNNKKLENMVNAFKLKVFKPTIHSLGAIKRIFDRHD